MTMLQLPRPTAAIAEGTEAPMAREWLKWIAGFVRSHEDNKLRFGAIVPHYLLAATISDDDNFEQSGATAGLGVNTYVGWAICNGNNGTPNLADRFIRSNVTGAGGTGGADTVAHTHSIPSGTSGDTTLTTAQIPAHAHSFATAVKRYVGDASGSHAWPGAGTNAKDYYGTESDGGTGGSHNHTTPAGTSGAASNTNNMPAYFELVFLMRVS
jgi:hypothetical protein